METHLWCHKLGCATECAGRRPIPHVLLTETVVCNLDVPVQRQQDIVKLQITIDDPVLVEVLERQTNFGRIESVQSYFSAFLAIFLATKLTVLSSDRIGPVECEASDHHR